MENIGPAYWVPAVAASEAKEHALFAEIQHAGPWQYTTHPHGGAVASWTAFDAEAFAAPQEIAPGVFYLPPKMLPSIYDLARPERGEGVEITLACGVQLTIPVAVIAHRQLRVGRRGERFGNPVTEYGRIACLLKERARTEAGIPYDDASLLLLMTLAISQRYRITSELLDDLAILAVEDIDPLLGVIWTGDPKALAPASAGGLNVSPILDSTGA